MFTAPHISPPVTLAQTSTPCRTMWERGTAQTCKCCGMENVQASLPRWVYRASPAQLLQAKLLPLLWMFGTRMCHGENPSLRKHHRACGLFPSPGPGCLCLFLAAVKLSMQVLGVAGWCGGSQAPLAELSRLMRPQTGCPRQGSDCMKLFTSDFAVYKRDVGWVGGTSQASGGLGNVLSAPACSKADTTGIMQVSWGSPGRLWSMGRKAEVALV